MSAFIAAFLSLAALAASAARAAEEPDAVYAKYHRAAAAGNMIEMAQYTGAAQRAELLAMSAAQKNALVKMLAATMPRAYSLRNKTVTPEGKAARLLVSGPSGIKDGDKAEILYGTIRMRMEGGAWKVAESDWTTTPPAGLQAMQSAGKPAAAPGPAAPKSAPPERAGAALVGSTSAPPVRKLGKAKEPCLYKPVMTAEDIENCK